MSGPLRLLTDAGPLQALQFARLLPTSAVNLGRRLFEAGGSRAWLYGAAMHGDAPVLSRAARSPASTSTCSATPSAGPARVAAPGA